MSYQSKRTIRWYPSPTSYHIVHFRYNYDNLYSATSLWYLNPLFLNGDPTWTTACNAHPHKLTSAQVSECSCCCSNASFLTRFSSSFTPLLRFAAPDTFQALRQSGRKRAGLYESCPVKRSPGGQLSCHTACLQKGFSFGCHRRWALWLGVMSFRLLCKPIYRQL